MTANGNRSNTVLSMWWVYAHNFKLLKCLSNRITTAWSVFFHWDVVTLVHLKWLYTINFTINLCAFCTSVNSQSGFSQARRNWQCRQYWYEWIEPVGIEPGTSRSKYLLPELTSHVHFELFSVHAPLHILDSYVFVKTPNVQININS